MEITNSPTPCRLDVVVPCYNEEEVLPISIPKLRDALETLRNEKLVSDDSQILFVDDGSIDKTWERIEEASNRFKDIVGLRLSQNVGHQNALLAGLSHSKADFTLSIDADLQDDLSVIPEMVKKGIDGHDVVFGIRSDRSTDTAFKKNTAELYYKLLSTIGVRVIQNHADFRLMRRDAVDRLLSYEEANLYLRGIVPLVGHNSSSVTYSRLERAAGETKYPLKKMLGLAIDGITSFSAVPLRMIAALGLFVFLIAFILALWVLWVRLVQDTAVPGWASTLLPTFFLGGIQLLSLGVIGEYVAKIYIESKGRPKYFVQTATDKDRR